VYSAVAISVVATSSAVGAPRQCIIVTASLMRIVELPRLLLHARTGARSRARRRLFAVDRRSNREF
jgi:hypothetical protein